MDLYIYGIGRGGRAVCSLLLSNGRMEHQWCKVFDGAMPTKSGPLPLLPGGRCWYQAMLYALAWGFVKIPKGEPVKVFTTSVGIKDWIERGDIPERYSDLYQHYLKASEGHKIEVELVGLGRNRTLTKIARVALTEFDNTFF